MFGIPRPTPLDVTFGLLGVPVRVSGWFWLGAGFFGWNLAGSQTVGDPVGLFAAHLLMVMLCILVSILLHEMGHALAARAFGMEWAIVLLMFGGLAFGRTRPGVKWWQNVLISLAGPFAQFALLAAIVAGSRLAAGAGADLNDASPLARTAYLALFFVNLVWPVLNLLPIYPLDGGQALRAVLGRFTHGSGVLWTARVGLAVCVLAGVAALSMRADPYGLVILGFLGVQNYQLMQSASGRRR